MTDKNEQNIPVLPNSDEKVSIDGPVIAGGGTILVTPSEDGYTFALSESVLARLAQLDAIEAAMKEYMAHGCSSTELFRDNLYALIRKGMKDNG